MEIYNGSGYDLLCTDAKGEGLRRLQDLERVSLWENDNEQILTRNLSHHAATSEANSY